MNGTPVAESAAGQTGGPLRLALNRVLTEYPIERASAPFSGSELAGFVRGALPKLLEALTPNPDTFIFKGSAGTGNWADCPWVAILDPDVTTSAQSGFYPVYLFSEDGARVFLSLNQGVTELKQEHGGRKARAILNERSGLYRSILGGIPPALSLAGPIDLAASSASSNSAYYEIGHVCGACYELQHMPPEDRLRADYLDMLDKYQRLASLVDPEAQPEQVAGASSAEEDYTSWRIHKRLDRNAALARSVKKIHGYVCQACDIDMEEVYGAVGHHYIEAHHLTPVAELKGRVLQRDPEADFAVLCPNCHRMIHRSGSPGDVEALRQVIHSEVIDF